MASMWVLFFKRRQQWLQVKKDNDEGKAIETRTYSVDSQQQQNHNNSQQISQNRTYNNIEHQNNITPKFFPKIPISVNPSNNNNQTKQKNMSRDTLKLIKQLYQQFQSLADIRITHHSLCTIEPYCEFLALISPVFNLSEMPSVADTTPYPFKQLLKAVKSHLKATRQKGLKTSDIDLVDLTVNESLEQARKIFEVVLCVMVESDKKEEFISKIMEMEQSEQEKLALVMQKGLDRLCQVQVQEKEQLMSEWQATQQQNQALYQQINNLQQQNLTLRKQLSQLHFNSQQYQRQRSLYLLTKPSLSYQPTIQSQPSQQSNLITNLKQKLLSQQHEHNQQLEELYDKIAILEERLKELAHYEELLVIYQEKYQEALAYVQKVSLYEKEKNKLRQEIMQRDLIVQELKDSLEEADHTIVELQQQKVDLELLLAKKNLQVKNAIRSNSTSRNNTKLITHNSNDQSLHLTAIPLKRFQTSISPQYTTKSIIHHRKSSQLANILAQQQQLSILSLNKSIFTPPLTQLLQKISTLQSTSESQSLQIKRLQRKCTQLKKSNQSHKQKLKCMRVVQNQNSKLQKIVIQLNTRKSQEIDLLVNCLYQTHHDFDFRFNKLLGNRNYQNQNKHLSDTLSGHCSQKSQEFKEITNCLKTNSKDNTKSAYYGSRQNRRTPSLKIQAQEQAQLTQNSQNPPIIQAGQRTQADLE